MFVLANMWFQTLMRQFFFSIDKIVFNFISTIYDFLITIARTSVLSQADIVDMANRVYKLLAIFMIFKVTFSLIMYVVNPDDFTDKNKGIGNLGTKIVMSLALLILTPYLFNYAYQLQTIILEDNSLSALIFGEDQMNSVESPFASAGDSMAYIVMAPFFAPNSAIDQLYECSQLTERDDLTGDIVFNKSCSGLSSTSLTSSDFACSSDANSLCALKNEKFSEQTLKNYVAGVTLGNIGLMFRQDMAIASSGDNFIIDYKYLFSTALGIVVVLLLISFCLDVALRSIKLAFLQLVAPIPILSYIDPKGGKDGMFKKWYEMCFKTYISLFIRLLAIYFAAYIISRIDRMVDIVDGSYVSNLLVKIFIIIGALMFAKQLPKILEGLGIKLDGGFTLNPLKKLDEQALGFKKGRQVAGRLGMAGVAGAAAFGTNMIATKGNLFKRLGSGIAGATSATARGIGNTIQGKKATEVFNKSYNAANRARSNRDDRQELGVSSFDVLKTNLQQRMGIPTNAQEQDVHIKRYDEVITAGKAAKSRAESEVDKKADSIITANGETLGALRDKVEILKSTSLSRKDFSSAAEYQAAVDELSRKTSQANSEYFKARKAATNAYVEAAANGTLSTTKAFGPAGSVFKTEDSIVRGNISRAISASSKYSLKDENGDPLTIDVANIGDSIQATEDVKTVIESSDEFRNAHLIEDQARKEKK